VPGDKDEETYIHQAVPSSGEEGGGLDEASAELGDDDDDDVDLKGDSEPGTGRYFADAVSPFLILSDKKQGHALGFLRDWAEDPANEDDAYHAAASTKLRIGELATLFHRNGWRKMHDDSFDELMTKMDTEGVTMPPACKGSVVEKRYLRWKDDPARFEPEVLSTQLTACLAWPSPTATNVDAQGKQKLGWRNADARVCYTDGNAADKCETMTNMLMKQMLTIVSKGGEEAVERTVAFCKQVDEAMCEMPDGLDEATQKCAGEIMSAARAVLEIANAEGSEGTMLDVERLVSAKSNKLAGAVKANLTKSTVWNSYITHYMKYATVNETYKGTLATAAATIPTDNYNTAATLNALVSSHKVLSELKDKMDPAKVKPSIDQVRTHVGACFKIHVEALEQKNLSTAPIDEAIAFYVYFKYSIDDNVKREELITALRNQKMHITESCKILNLTQSVKAFNGATPTADSIQKLRTELTDAVGLEATLGSTAHGMDAFVATVEFLAVQLLTPSDAGRHRSLRRRVRSLVRHAPLDFEGEVEGGVRGVRKRGRAGQAARCGPYSPLEARMVGWHWRVCGCACREAPREPSEEIPRCIGDAFW
jgi:hypothetical protein